MLSEEEFVSKVTDGIEAAQETAADPAVAKDAARIVALNRQPLADAAQADDDVLLAMEALLIDDGKPRPAALVLFRDRAVIAWQKGMLRPKQFHLTVRYTDAVRVTCGRRDDRQFSNAVVLSFHDGEERLLALPQNDALAARVNEVFVAAPR